MVGIAGNAYTPFAPSIIGALVDYRGFTLEAAGRLASLEFGAIAVGTIASVLYMHRIALDIKTIARVCLILMILSNLGTLFVLHNMVMFYVCRIMSGLVAGVIWCTAAVAVTRTRDVERTTAILYGSPYFMGAIGLTFLPMLYPAYGVSAAYISIILLCAIALPLLLFYPQGGVKQQKSSVEDEAGPVQRVQWIALLVLLLALYINYAANSGIWSYFERLGVSYGHEAKIAGPVVGASQLVAIAGVICAALLGGRIGNIKPILLGTFLITISSFILFYSASLTVFFTATALFNFSITFLTPYYFILLGKLIPSGRGVLWGNLILWLGFSSGPAMVSFFLADGSFDFSIIVTIIGFILSAILVVLYTRIAGSQGYQ